MLEPAPYREDFASLALAAKGLRYPVMLVSCPGAGGELRRYSVLAAEPISVIQARSPRDGIEVSGPPGSRDSARFDDISRAFEAALGLLAPLELPAPNPWFDGDIPCLGGLVGFMAYEAGARFERMPVHETDGPAPSLWFGCYPAAYVADHARREAWWVCREPRATGSPGFLPILERIKDWLNGEWPAEFHAPLEGSAGSDLDLGLDSPPWEPSLDAAAYRRAVERVKDYLRRGDAYQVNLTVRSRRKFEGDPARLFGELLRCNPAPYAAYLSGADWAVLSNSPELLLDLRRDGAIQTRPIKGTIRARAGEGSGADQDQMRALAASAKDRAEHLMIVDLERNDLGRVCEYGSIQVDPLMAVESYRGLHHLVSTARGRMRRGLGPADAIGALFPGGSVTGAPKVRALEIIHELEPVARGAYCGAIGWISPEGDCRFNLAIRTLSLGAGALDLHAGGGIVIDSDPESEAEERRIKGSAMAEAVEAALRGQGAGAYPVLKTQH